jgi:antitoxin (DNA-binding transcriptional repressor) of toxin-antitoxin stability system
MTTATVRDLRYHFSEIEARLRQGEEVQIRKRKRVIAKLVPLRPEPKGKAYLPDFKARRRKIFGDKGMSITGASIVAWDRSGE